jgi:hypothetical protein
MEKEPILWMGIDKMITRYIYGNYFTDFLADVNGKTVFGSIKKMG